MDAHSFADVVSTVNSTNERCFG